MGQQSLDAGGRARHRTRHTEGEAAHVHGVQAVDVLVRVHLQQRGLEVDLGRRRVLHQHGADVGVFVEAVDRVDQVSLRRIVAEVMMRAREAQLLRLLHLHANVAGRSGVAADQDRAQSGVHALRAQLLDSARELREYGIGDRSARHVSRSHAFTLL